MLLNYLKKLHSRQVVDSSILASKNWVSEASSIKKTFKFESFELATVFQRVAIDSLTNNRFNYHIHNVYNQVTITINNQVTERDASILNQLEHFYVRRNNTINDSLNRDLIEEAKPERLDLRDNIQHVPTTYKLHSLDFCEERKLLH